MRHDDRVEAILTGLPGDEPQTAETLLRRLAAVDPHLAARGLQWLQSALRRSRGAHVLRDGRFVRAPRPEDVDDLAEADEEPSRVPAPRPPRSRVRRFVVLDLEANADRSRVEEHEIIEIGACLVERGRVVDELHLLVRPTRPLTREVQELTGITPAELAAGMDLAAALGRLLDFVGSLPVVAHNGSAYDFPLLMASVARADLPPPPGDLLDSLDLAHLVFPRVGVGGGPNADGTRPPLDRSLDGLAAYFWLERSARHRALDDARLTVAVLNALLNELSSEQPVRRLQRWILHTGGHPWAGFLPPGEREPLERVVAPPDPPLPRAATGTFDLAQAITPLREGGALMTDGRRPRPQQLEMASRIADAMAHRKKLLVEAPTGTGKTLAYLVPAVAYATATGRPVIVATFSKVLQNQVLSTLYEMHERVRPIRTVLLKGRENFIDLEALDAQLDDRPSDEAEAFAVGVLVGWVAQTRTGDWEDLNAWAIEVRTPLAQLRWALRVEEAPGVARTRLQELCFYRRALEQLDVADIAVLNHAVLVSNRNAWDESVRDVIIDEAHNFEEAATSALTEQLEADWLGYLLRSIDDPARRAGFLRRYARATGWSRKEEPLRSIVVEVGDAMRAAESFGQALIEYVRERSGARREVVARFGTAYRFRRGLDTGRPEFRVVLDAARHLSDCLHRVRQLLDELPIPSTVRPPYRTGRLEAQRRALCRNLGEAQRLLRAILSCEDESRFIYLGDLTVEDDRWAWGLRKVPLSVAPVLRDLWDSLDSVVLCSATLRVGGSFTFIQGQLGLESAHVLALPSPYTDLADRELVVVPGHLPTPRGQFLEEFKEEAPQEIARLLIASRGRALVLFTARERLAFVRDHVRPILEQHQLPVLAQGEGPSAALAERKRMEPATTLLATRSFWEGIDIPGEALSLLVLEKLPFDPPGDPIVSARADAVALRGGDPFTEYLVPRAVLRFVQGVGRLIRSETDRGVAVVLDKRLRRAVPYRETFLSGLQGPPRLLFPATPQEGYQAIAEHLDVQLDEELWEKIRSVPSPNPWDDLPTLSPSECADEALVRKRLAEVRNRFGFAEWRPGQEEVMLRFLRGEDVLAILPTGSGKSLTYQIPALLGEGLTLVISPLVALMRDQVETLRGRRLKRVAALYTGMSQAEQEEVLQRARAGACKILYVSPERLWSTRFRTAMRHVPIARVAIDEAHCVSQWGHSFRPEYAAIREAIDQITAGPVRPPILAVTATATPEVQGEIVTLLGLKLQRAPIVRAPERPELRYYVEDCRDMRDRDLQVARIVEAFRGKPAIVYVPTRADAVRIADLLRALNHLARAYHGGMSLEERVHVEEAFRDGELDVVVATKAFGLGVDKPDIELILHLEMPASLEDYIQETGRAARGAIDGRGPTVGTCVLLRTPGDCRVHQYFIRTAAPDPDVVRQVWDWTAKSEYLVPQDIAASLSLEEDQDPDVAIGLAVAYLTEQGCLKRLADVAWEGRVWVAPDASDRLPTLTSDPIQRQAHKLLALVQSHGTEYRADSWSERMGCTPEELEALLLELSHRDLIWFVNWKVAWHLRRVSGAQPDWAKVGRRCQERREAVAALSRVAREFRSQDTECRRARMLRYLGATPPSACKSCDVCVPSLPRPWRHVTLTREQLEEGIPSQTIWLAALADLGEGHRYSINTLIRCLIGETHPHELPTRLKRSFWFGRLALCGRDGAARALEAVVSRGWATKVSDEYNGTPYVTVRITEEGRKQL